MTMVWKKELPLLLLIIVAFSAIVFLLYTAYCINKANTTPAVKSI